MKSVLIMLIPILSIISYEANAQGLFDGKNFIQNSSFEEADSCPGNALSILFVRNWISPSSAAQYYTSCAPFPDIQQNSNNVPYTKNMYYKQYAHSGNAFIELGSIYIDSSIYMSAYIEAELRKSLESDSIYCVELYANLPDWVEYNFRKSGSSYYFNFFTCLFSNYSIDTTPEFTEYYYDIEPSIKIYTSDNSAINDTLNWVRMSSQYKAAGNERFFVLGNFKIHRSDIELQQTNPYVSYIVSSLFIDDVAVYKGKCREEEKPQKTFFNLYPNPGSGVFSLNYGVSQDAQLVVYDILGRTVLNETLAADKVLHHFSMQQYSNGMYFLKVLGANNDEELFSQKFLLQR